MFFKLWARLYTKYKVYEGMRCKCKWHFQFQQLPNSSWRQRDLWWSCYCLCLAFDVSKTKSLQQCNVIYRFVYVMFKGFFFHRRLYFWDAQKHTLNLVDMVNEFLEYLFYIVSLGICSEKFLFESVEFFIKRLYA